MEVIGSLRDLQVRVLSGKPVMITGIIILISAGSYAVKML